MSYEFYKILHILGLVLTVFGLFGLASVLWNDSHPKPTLRKIWAISHGIGLLVLIVAGFGLLAKMGMARQMPLWAYGKIFLWFCLGGIFALIKRKPQYMKLWIGLIFIFIFLALFLVVTKPLS